MAAATPALRPSLPHRPVAPRDPAVRCAGIAGAIVVDEMKHAESLMERILFLELIDKVGLANYQQSQMGDGD